MKTTELLKWFKINYPNLVNQLRNCDHDYDTENQNPFHLENDCFTHSLMVLHEADRNHLPFELKVASLLHDIGKPHCRELKLDTKRVSFFNHEAVSAFMSLDITKKLGLNDVERLHIFKLICLHTQPFKQNLHDLQTDLQDYGLYYSLLKLSEADQNGRFHEDESRKIDFNFVATPRTIREYAKKVVLLVGLPNSGKSTYIEQVKTDRDFVVSRDSIIDSLGGTDYNDKWKRADQKRVDKKLEEQFKTAIEGDFDRVLVDMTNLTKKGRRKVLNRFKNDIGKEAVVFLPTLEEITKRNNNRTGKHIAEKVITDMMKRFCLPTYGEGFDNIEFRME